MLNYKIALLWKFFDRIENTLWLEIEHGYEDPNVRIPYDERQALISARDRIADALGL